MQCDLSFEHCKGIFKSYHYDDIIRKNHDGKTTKYCSPLISMATLKDLMHK